MYNKESGAEDMNEKKRVIGGSVISFINFLLNSIFILGFFFLSALNVFPFASVDVKLRVMTFNVRFDNPEDGPMNWKFRREAAAGLIREGKIDLLGTQEVLKNQLDDFLRLLPEYGYVGVGRADGKTAGEYSAIFYRKNRFSAVATGNFWLSLTPEIPGSRGWDAACERIVTWAIFEERKNGLRLAFFNTHFDHLGQVARRESAVLLMEKIRQIAGSLPVILTGDFNATPESEPVGIILGYGLLLDSRKVAGQVCGPPWTFHGFGQVPEPERTLIDYIFVSPHFQVIEYSNISELKGEIYYSDHNPVMVVLKIKP